MKKDEVAMKTRQTKLSKKSSEELINIILKKDNVEKNLANQITRLKNEVTAYQDVNKNLRNDIAGTEKMLQQYRLEATHLKDENEHINENLKNAMDCIEELNDEIYEKGDKYYKVSIYGIVSTIVVIVETLFLVF